MKMWCGKSGGMVKAQTITVTISSMMDEEMSEVEREDADEVVTEWEKEEALALGMDEDEEKKETCGISFAVAMMTTKNSTTTK